MKAYTPHSNSNQKDKLAMNKIIFQIAPGLGLPPDSSPPFPNPNTLDLTNFYKVYFDIAYSLCITPFRLTVKGKNSAGSKLFYIRTWWLQQLLCGLLYFLSLFWLLAKIRKYVPIDSRDPVDYFKFTYYFITMAIQLLEMKKFWFRQKSILKLVAYVDTPGFREGFCSVPHCTLKRHSYLLRHFWKKWAIRLYCSMTILGAIVACLSDGVHSKSKKAPQEWGQYFPWYWKEMEKDACYNFFLAGWNARNGSCAWSKFRMMASKGLAVPTIIGFYYENFFRFFTSCLFLMTSLTLWSASRSMAIQLAGGMEATEGMTPYSSRIFNVKPVGGTSASKRKIMLEPGRESYPVYELIKSLEGLAALITKSIGPVISSYLVTNMIYYAIRFDDFFVGSRSMEDFMLKFFRIVFSMFRSFAFLLFSADICYQVKSVKKWLANVENRKKVPEIELQTVLEIVDSNAIAIRGNDVFPITYGLLSQMGGVVVTYFLICLHSSHHP